MSVNLRSVMPVIVSVVAALALAACGASDPPPTSPLDPSGEPGGGTVVVGVPTALPTFPPTATPADGTPGPIDDERLAGAAIDALAGWLGVPASTFTGVEIEAATWPNACLGVTWPGIACAEVVTPGARITVTTFGNGATYHVHADATGRLVWAPLIEAVREVASVDTGAGRITFAPVAGSDEMGSELVIVPGSRVELALAALAEGDRVYVAVAPSVEPDAGVAPIVILAPAE